MELSRQKKRLAVAKKGFKLLKDKQDALIKMFLERVHAVKKLRTEIETDLKKAYQSFLIARSVIESTTCDVLFLSSGVTIELTASTQNNLGVKTPHFDFTQNGNLYSYGFAGTSGELDNSLGVFSEVMTKMVQLSEQEKVIELMAVEIEKTRRRVNALEYNLIPSANEAIRFIRMKLDELERGSLSRLMRIKDMVRNK
jgi:V/A-type H+-transporting ATPase subunit D